MTIILGFICGLVLAAFGWLVWQFSHAPEGYEDEAQGFIYGPRPK